MAKIPPIDLTNPSYNAERETIQNKLNELATFLNDAVAIRDDTGIEGEPKQLENVLDMNRNEIINLPFPTTPLEPVRKMDLAVLLVDAVEDINIPSRRLPDVSEVHGRELDDGDTVILDGWHPGSTLGGGEFIYKGDMEKVLHDGGHVLSTTVPWTNVVADYLGAVGETSPGDRGCLVRVGHPALGYNPYMWGAKALQYGEYANPLAPAPGEIFDDTAAVQACWDAADVVAVRMDAAPFWWVTNVILPRKLFFHLQGRSSIEALPSADNYYLCASYNHINNVAEAQHPIMISDKLRFSAGNIKTHPLIIQSWNVDIDVETMGGVGDGCVYAAQTRNGTTFPVYSMVNPRIKIESRNNGGNGFRCLDGLRNNATDGYILPGSTCHDNALSGVYIDAGAGWDVTGNYYANAASSIRFNAVGKGTRVHHAFLDDDTSLDINTHNVYGIMRLDHCDIAGVVTSAGNSDVVGGTVGIKSVGNHYRNALAYIKQQWFGADRLHISMNDTFENQPDPFRFSNGSSTGRFQVVNAHLIDEDRFVSCTFDAPNKGALITAQAAANLYGEVYRQRSNGIAAGGAFSHPFAINGLGSFTQRAGILTIVTRVYNTGTTRVVYTAHVVVSSKSNGAHPWVVNLIPTTNTPAEWTTGVGATVAYTSDNKGVLTITGDPADADGYGNSHLIWY